MTSMKQVVTLVTVLAFALFLAANVSAFGYVDSVEVDGVNAYSGSNIAVFSGESVPVKIVFYATDNADDVRVKAWISGEEGLSVSTERFDVLADNYYSRTVSVEIPEDINPDEELSLWVSVEDRNTGLADTFEVSLTAQRGSYDVEVLNVEMDSEVKAGETLALDVVLKNTGRQLAEDTFVKVSIPALGIEKKGYFGDISAVDEVDPDRDDAVEGMLYLALPNDATTGVYVVEIEAYNGDFSEKITRKVAVTGASDDTIVLSSVASKTVNVGEAEEYSLTIVNTGSNVRVYNLVFETASGLAFNADDTVVVVPAGVSKTVKYDVEATKAGSYNFAVNVYSDGQLVKTQDYVANAEEGNALAGNATVLLTVILAIIFIVLLVVLVVLLTRKPEKVEEFGESYY